jgi:hypothetical protein
MRPTAGAKVTRVRVGTALGVLLLLVLLLAIPSSPAAQSVPLSGERVKLKQVLIPLYDWDTGKVLIGSTPVNCQYVETCAPQVAKHIPKFEIQPFYLVVYPLGVHVPVQCTHVPADNCPDHGPIIADGAMQLVPSVYGEGVLGHNHISAPVTSKDYRVIASPDLVLFKTRAAARELVTTKKQILALVKAGKAFLYPAPQYMFINYIVPSHLYDEGTPVKPKPTHNHG